MATELDFQISDNTLNRLGFRIFTEGIRTESFEKNPVALYDHNGSELAIGKWKNLTKEPDGTFKGTCEFDEDDEFAMKLAKKYQKGYMKGVSISVDPCVESVDGKDMLPGQEYPSVIESELLEISLCNVPGNKNSIKLIRGGKPVQLSLIQKNTNHSNMAKEEKTVEQLMQENSVLRTKMAKDLVELHVSRGVLTDQEKDFFQKSAEADYDGTKVVLALRKGTSDQTDAKDQLASQLVELHIQRGAVSEAEKSFYVNAAKLDYNGCKKILEGRKGTDSIDNHIVEMNAGSGSSKSAKDPSDRSSWAYLDYYKNDPESLRKLKMEKPEEHKRLLDAHKKALGKTGKFILEEGDED